MSDFMKDREREWQRSIEGDKRRVREMDRMIETSESTSIGKKIALIRWFARFITAQSCGEAMVTMSVYFENN